MSLPTGFRIRIADDVRRLGGGSVLVGGSPLTAVRLSPQAVALMSGGDVLEVKDHSGSRVGERLLSTNLGLPVLETHSRANLADITVVIPARDRADQLDQALSSLAGARVLVIDDASADPRAIARIARKHGAAVYHLDHNLGPAAARNLGLSRVRTPYVAFVDSDVRVSPDVLLSLTRHFADPRVALVAPHVRGRAVNAVPRWFERYEQAIPSLGLGQRPVSVQPGAAVSWLPAACLLGRTDQLAGGFDPKLRVGEDVDLVWRLVADGRRVRYDPSVAAYHDVRPTLRGWFGRKFVYGTGGAGLAERHPGNMATAVLSPAMALAGIAILSRHRWSLPVAACATARGCFVLRRNLPAVPERNAVALELGLRGLGWTLRQESALVLRHWWPLILPCALVSQTARRAVLSSLLVDVVATRLERPELPFVRTFVGRRLDDLAYGAGLWFGAARTRSLRCTRIRVPRGHRASVR